MRSIIKKNRKIILFFLDLFAIIFLSYLSVKIHSTIGMQIDSVVPDLLKFNVPNDVITNISQKCRNACATTVIFSYIVATLGVLFILLKHILEINK